MLQDGDRVNLKDAASRLKTQLAPRSRIRLLRLRGSEAAHHGQIRSPVDTQSVSQYKTLSIDEAARRAEVDSLSIPSG